MADAAAALAPEAPLAPGQSPLAPSNSNQKPETVTVTAKAPDPREAELAGEFDKFQDKTSAIDKATGALNPPKLEIPPAPQPKQTDPTQVWGSAAMALAAIGSLLTRTPLTTALNSAANVMKAYKQNDVETAQMEYDRWKTSSEMAVKQQDFQIQAYKAALQKASVDQKAAVADFMAYAKAFGDDTAYEAARQRGQQGAEKLLLDYGNYNLKIKEAIPKLEEVNNFQAAIHDPDTQAKMAKMSPTEKGQFVADLLSKTAPDLSKANGLYSDDDLQAMASQYWAGDKSVGQGLGYGNAGSAARVRLRHFITEEGKSQGMSDEDIGKDLAANIAEFSGTVAGERTLGTTAARIGLGSAEMEQLIPQVKDASKKLPRGSYPSMNAMVQAMQAQTGDPNLRSLAVRLQGLKSAYSQVLTRGGVPTDTARKSADDLFSTKDPQTVLDTALAAIQQEASAIKAAPGMVREQLRAGLKGGQSKMAPLVSTQAQYDALPPGATYTESDGNTYQKPKSQ